MDLLFADEPMKRFIQNDDRELTHWLAPMVLTLGHVPSIPLDYRFSSFGAEVRQPASGNRQLLRHEGLPLFADLVLSFADGFPCRIAL